jgi:hypothetical protein
MDNSLLVGATIIEFKNREDGKEPWILVKGADGKYYSICIHPDYKFSVARQCKHDPANKGCLDRCQFC